MRETGLGDVLAYIRAEESVHRLDQAFDACRAKLDQEYGWWYGPYRAYHVGLETAKILREHVSLQGRRYLDLGCGSMNPFATAALMYINGAAETIGLDLEPLDDERKATRALYELLLECLGLPEEWNISGSSSEYFAERIRHFDLAGLKKGALWGSLPAGKMSIHQVNIYDPAVHDIVHDIGIMSSNAVLEHFDDIKAACRWMFEVMRPGAVAYHVVDLKDHRAYSQPRYDAWSFLCEPEGYVDRSGCNRARSPEIKAAFLDAGFSILSCHENRATPPADLRERLSPAFRHFTDAELSVVTVKLIVQKP